MDGKQQQQTLRPVSLAPVNKNAVINIDSSSSSSEKTSRRGDHEEDTADSRARPGASKVYWFVLELNVALLIG